MKQREEHRMSTESMESQGPDNLLADTLYVGFVAYVLGFDKEHNGDGGMHQVRDVKGKTHQVQTVNVNKDTFTEDITKAVEGVFRTHNVPFSPGMMGGIASAHPTGNLAGVYNPNLSDQERKLRSDRLKLVLDLLREDKELADLVLANIQADAFRGGNYL